MNHKSLFILPLCLLTLVFSCGKKDVAADPPPPPAPPAPPPPVLPPAPNYEDSIKNGLWAYYNFNNGSFADSSGNNRHMRGLNNIQFGTDKGGKENHALHFDGIDDYTIVDAGTTLPEGDFTVTFWMNAEKTSSGRIFNKGIFNDARGVATTCGFDDDNKTNKLLFTINEAPDVCNNTPDNTSLAYINSEAELAQNVWYFVIVSHVNGVEHLYLNGKLMARKPTVRQTFKNCTTAPIYFGIWWLQDPRAYMGKLDDVRIYTRGLSDNEIKYLSGDKPADTGNTK